jgi:ABC-type sugar transport system substrate-binding protein
MQENQDHRVEHPGETREEIAKRWIRDNLEEAQQLIDNIVGIKGITEDPLKAAAELEALVKLTPHTDTTNAVYCCGGDCGGGIIAANTEATLERQHVVVVAQPPHEELYGY